MTGSQNKTALAAPSAAAAAAAPARVHRFERALTIRFSHCDPAGIVFYPRYFTMFNDLVEDWVTQALGIPYADLLGRRRTGLPTVSLNTQFSAVSRMGDEVMMGLTLEHVGRSSIRLGLGCRQGTQQRVTMEQVLVVTDLDTHRAIAIPDDLRQAMLSFQQD
jgi:4-hydroxybenzoyl-CoA thioesterase